MEETVATPETPESDAPEAPETVDDNESTDTDDEFDAGKAKARITKANNEAKNLRARLKELEPLAQRAKQLEDEQKTEAQRLNEALEAERTGRSAAERRLLQFEVGAEKGVPGKLVRLLSGSTKEEIEEAADVLLSEMAAVTKVDRPKGRIANGSPSIADDDLDPIAFFEKTRSG